MNELYEGIYGAKPTSRQESGPPGWILDNLEKKVSRKLHSITSEVTAGTVDTSFEMNVQHQTLPK